MTSFIQSKFLRLHVGPLLYLSFKLHTNSRFLLYLLIKYGVTVSLLLLQASLSGGGIVYLMPLETLSHHGAITDMENASWGKLLCCW